MRKGDIVLLYRFPILNYRKRKNRPALILIERESDVTAAFISTQIRYKGDTDIILTPSPENGLKKKSVVMLSKIATLDRSLVVNKLGTLDDDHLKLLNKMLARVLEIDVERNA